MSTQGSVQNESFTGLILLSGIDTPGITQALFETLAPFAVTIVDIEQVVIRDRVILTALIALDKSHSKAIEEDLAICATTLKVDIAVAFSQSSADSIAAKSGLLHVVVLGNPLRPSAIAMIAKTLAMQGANIERIYRTASYPVTAVEFVVSGATQQSIRTALAQVSVSENIDIAVQPGGLMRWAKKLILMDVDSTLIAQEVIDLLAAKAGAGDLVKEITESAMRGEIDFEKSLRERVALLKGLPQSVMEEVRAEITLTPGARTLIRTLKRLGHTVAVVSGGFIEVIEPILIDLGITLYRANSLEIHNGILTGGLIGAIIDRPAKAQALVDFALKEGVGLEQTIAIGDGANDLDMITAAGLGIAFNAKPAVRAAADSAVSQPYLDSVLYLMGITREDVEEADN
ncbi:MAG: phosphoserine phosphatase SerB [Actinobacteria bacterium]|nr:phosphoserine phosphatase SerB [Actinomycetota bacterium]